ncbi:hypothetical protein G6L63_08610 [Agrobacterium vitis]|uniref:phage/plasmid primase, P4 family n=1 Tax=Agrobacterium vitis TaxID=373 RepID=UPI001571A80E|nr:phage/plasmid primase, P4 family [Agrobacterium vitis]NSZ47975.1 hypothetical protein [Agrobacterium vitis]UJL72868.1 hypothetical protein AVCG412_08605 [Agrobacterium vitis]
MTEPKKPDLPESVRKILEDAEAQRRAYAGRPDPLPIDEPEPDEDVLELSGPEILEECAALPETDIGNANRLLTRYGRYLRHVTHVGWHGFDGQRWMEDASGAVVRRFAHRTAELIDDEAILLDCSTKEQAAIEAGRDAAKKLQDMGRPPTVREAVDDDRLTELNGLIADMKEAEREKVMMGNPKAEWPEEAHVQHQKIKDRIKTGQQAERARRKMVDATSSWTPEQYAEYAELEKMVDAMDEVEVGRRGRMSSRHSHAKSAAGTSKIDNMLKEAVPYCSLDVKDLNTDLYAINCQSGTLRFYCRVVEGVRRWKIRMDKHQPEDLISKMAEVDFTPDEDCPIFRNFLKQVMPNVEYRNFLQRYLGYCLLGMTGEQCLLFFYGAGRNGKSTFVDLAVDILADYAASMSIDSFAGEKRRSGAEATPDLARLPGVRLVAASEPEMGVQLKDALIKSLTGGEPLPVRKLNQDFFELIPQFKIILSGNHKPIIKDDSDGIWRRVKLVPWEIQIPEEDVDRDLPRKLREERNGIFAWMVAGAIAYLETGLQEPEGIKDATREYREESDPIGAFLRHACHITGADADQETPLDLYNAYQRYAKREGLSEFHQPTFTRRLPDQTRKSWKGPDGGMHQFRRGRSNGTVYYGIRVRDEFRPEAPGGQYPDYEPMPEGF